jgi:long-chain-fatty-acid--[acyl-carrier-protein] ligase
MALWMTATEDVELKPCEWGISDEERKSHHWDFDWLNNVLELFKKYWKKDRKATLVYDAMFWLQTRQDVVLKSFLLSEYIKKIPWKHIGVMLPALWSTTLIILATYLAEKIPVMMNWTHPESGFDHCVKFSKTTKILTSRTFYKTINIEWLKKYDFVFLEDLLKNIPLSYKLKAAFKSLYFPLPKKLDETAVVLYTSWSESLPKAVWLSHKNLISEWKGTTGILSVHNDETLFCYLPPFHSFWFTVNTIFPIIGWLRAVNTPDPNDSITVAKLIAHTKPTILCTTPTFLKNLLNIAKPEQLISLRYVITWGEKCSELVFEKTRKIIPNCVILEGYGITETSPIISINPIEKQKPQSVWISITGWEIKVCDLSTDEELWVWEEGMIYYSWDNVFSWYEDKSLESPFLKQWKKIWYRTWDLWYLDEDWYLFITWRKKRFLKLWWEMISLPFLEELIQGKYWSSDEINLALEWKEKDDWIEIVLFVVWLKLKVKEVNEYLKSKGVSNLIQITRIEEIDSIPLLWTWKVDYKVLKEKLW